MSFKSVAFNALRWISHSVSEKDPNDGDLRFSIGRSSFVAWFWISMILVIKYPATLALLPVYFWMLGFSLLAFVIGREYLVLSFFQKNGNGKST